MKIKQIQASTFKDQYRENIQLQFNDDIQFIEFVKTFATLSTNYQQTLINLNKFLTISDNLAIVTEQNYFILNSIGALLNLPNIDYFANLMPKDTTGKITSYELYLLIIKGQIAKNNYDGTNKSLIDLLNSVFENKYLFILTDTGTMAITLSLYPLQGEISEAEETLFKQGWFTPKPAGVGVTLTTLSAEDTYFTWDTDYAIGPPAKAGWDTAKWLE